VDQTFKRSPIKEQLLVETLIEMVRLGKFEVSKMTDCLSEKLRENQQVFKHFLIGHIADVGRRKNIKALRIYFD
jgi:hypothetical protein